jgi:hypothetical protein
MKRSIVSVYLVGGFLLSLVASACDNPRQQSSSPTAPSATHSGNLSLGASQSSARSLTDHTLPPDQSFNVVNPCTGLPSTLTAHPVEWLYHENMDATGGGHFTLTGVIRLTLDGFSGRETVSIGGNFGPGHSGIAEQRFTDSETLGDGSAQRIVVHISMYIVFKDGVPVLERDSFSVECVGKPVD